MIRLGAFLVMVAAFGAACSSGGDDSTDSAPQETRTFTRADGREVAYNYPPRRIGVFAQGAGDTIVRIGRADMIALVLDPADFGLSADDVDSVPEEINEAGSVETFVEYLAEQNLDLVILPLDIGTGSLVAPLDDAGVPVLCCEANDVRTIDDVYEYLLRVGEILGAKSEASALVESLQARADAVVRTDVSVVYLVEDGTFAGQGSLVGNLFGHLGARIRPADSRNVETVILGPDAVSELDPDCVFGPSVWLERLDPDEWSEVAAIREGRVFEVEFDDTWPGPRLFDMVEQAASDLADCASRLAP